MATNTFAIAPDDAIVVSIGLCGHSMKPVASREEADTFFVDRNGKEYGYRKRVSNIYGYEIRSRNRMTGACRALLYSGTLETKLGEPPVVPPAAIIAARAFEATETQLKPKQA